MKQLKVVVNDTPSNLLTQSGGYVTANFINPVEVKKGSLICLDKFNATSKNISQNFGIVSQTFTIGVNVINEAQPVPFSSVTIPAGSYSVVSYIAAVNQAVNAQAISAFRTLPADLWSISNYANVQSQNGMRVYLQLVDGLLARWTSQCYGYTDFSTTPSAYWSPSSNTAIDIDGYYYSTDTLDASITGTSSLVNGGGLSTTAVIRPATTGIANWVYGIATDSGAVGGRILQKTGSTNLFVQNDAGIQTEIANSPALFPGAYAGTGNARFMIYQSQGKFRFAYYDDITDPDLVWYVSNPATQDMGNWNFSYVYSVIQTFTGAFTGFGPSIYTPQLFTESTLEFPYPSIPLTYVSLSNASQFALVFGFKIADSQIFKEATGATFQALLTGSSPANALQLRSAFELAIEIIDLPLKTYFAQSGTTNKSGYGGRQNVVCYFTPTSSIEAEGLYSFSNPVHQWLDIDNSADTTLHSLSFRVYNSYTGDSFISNSMGFNLLIKSPEERMEN